jgi:hypothetical protein
MQETPVEAPSSQDEGGQEFALPAREHFDIETLHVPPAAHNASPQAALEQRNPLQSETNNGVSCEVSAQAHQPDAPLAGLEAAAAATQDGSANEVCICPSLFLWETCHVLWDQGQPEAMLCMLCPRWIR